MGCCEMRVIKCTFSNINCLKSLIAYYNIAWFRSWNFGSELSIYKYNSLIDRVRKLLFSSDDNMWTWVVKNKNRTFNLFWSLWCLGRLTMQFLQYRYLQDRKQKPTFKIGWWVKSNKVREEVQMNTSVLFGNGFQPF